MTVTVVVIVGLGFLAASLLRPFAPTLPPNTEALQHGDYLAKNASGLVRWRAWGPETIQEAKERSKPILLTLGRWGSPAAQRLDREVFADPEVAEQVNKSFVAARIDLEEHPEWQGVFLPIDKASLLPEPGFEMAALNPNSGLASWTAKLSGGAKMDFSFIVKLLTDARREAVREAPSLQEKQDIETGQLSDLRSALPDRRPLEDLARRIKADRGMLNESGKVTLRPWIWRGLASAGMVQEATDSLLSWAGSTMMDGAAVNFYFTGEGPAGLTPGPVKLLEPNLDAMVFAARAARVLGRTDLAYFAVRMAGGIEIEFLGTRWPATTLVGEVAGEPRSNRFAYRPSALWSQFSSAEEAVLKTSFRMDLLTSGLTMAQAKDLQTVLAPSEEVESVRAQLLSMRMKHPPDRSTVCSTLGAAMIASRFLEAGALLGRKDLEEVGQKHLSMAELAWKKGTVKPLLNRTGQVHSLSAALALDEAYLMNWNLTGDASAKSKGLKLIRELVLRQNAAGRGFSFTTANFCLPLADEFPINSFDGAARSDAAALIELLTSWAAITGDSELASLADEARGRWRGQALLASPAWMSLCDSVLRSEKPPVMAASREEWLKEASRSFDRIVLRKEPAIPGATAAPKSPSPSE